MATRLVRTRPALPSLRTEFAINCKLEITGPGITEAEALACLKEYLRYAAAAHMFKVPHPTGERDAHRRAEENRWGGSAQLTII